ncbi:MAG: hypothetical protein AB7S26_42215 [Sandaracinaceae bacterium]
MAVALASCTSGPQRCSHDTECSNGKCDVEAGLCATDCSGDADCDVGEYCSSARWATPGCEPVCTAGASRAGRLCVDGRWVGCDDAGSAFDCSVCGCDGGDYCATDGQCQPPLDAGEICTEASQCTTRRCAVPESGGERRCVVGTERACTADTCAGLCIEGLCFPECASHDACADDRYRCYARRTGEQFYCRRYCEFTDCPAGQECVRTNDPEVLGGGYFCFPPG